MSRHIADRLPACQKIPAPKRKDPESPVSESNFFTEVPASEKHESASPELPSYRSQIFDAITQKVTEQHEKPVLDEYYEDLEALGGGPKDPHPGNGGAIDRMSLEEAAEFKVQAGLKAAEPAIAEDIKPYEDEMISVYKPIAGNARSLAQPLYFSRAEIQKASSNKVVIPEQNPSTETPAEEQINASSTDDLFDPDADPASPEKNASEAALILDAIVTGSETGI